MLAGSTCRDAVNQALRRGGHGNAGRTRTRWPNPAIPNPASSDPRINNVVNLFFGNQHLLFPLSIYGTDPPRRCAPRYSSAAEVACNMGDTITLAMMMMSVFSLMLNGPGLRSMLPKGREMRLRGMMYARNLPSG